MAQATDLVGKAPERQQSADAGLHPRSSNNLSMIRYFAFLRAINVGGHVVKMDRLRGLFESMGFSNVETFIASGNVIFESKSRNVSTLESRIEKELTKSLGYNVTTFIRTEPELVAIANCKPFSETRLKTAVAFNIVFLGKSPDAETTQQLLALQTEFDDLCVRGREIYWLGQKRLSETVISYSLFNKALGMPTTVRGANTIKKMATKYIGQNSKS